MAHKMCWFISGEFQNHSIPEVEIVINSRPTCQIEEIEFKENTWIPGKTEWNELIITLPDTKTGTIPSQFDPLFALIRSQFKQEETNPLLGVITLKLKREDEVLETWVLHDSFIANIDLGYVDELYDINIGLKFNSCEFIPVSSCPSPSPNPQP